MAWANYIPSIEEYKKIFPDGKEEKRPDEISIMKI